MKKGVRSQEPKISIKVKKRFVSITILENPPLHPLSRRLSGIKANGVEAREKGI